MASPTSNRQALKERLAFMRQQVESLEQEIEKVSIERSEPVMSAPGVATRLARLRDGLQQVLRAPSAPTALNLLLSLCVQHGERAILFILRRGALWAWSGLDARGERLPLSQFSLNPEESPLLASALKTQQTQRAAAAEPWEASAGGMSAAGATAIPLSIERSGGILWFDAGAEAAEGAVEVVECLVAAASAALEIIAHKRSAALPANTRMTTDDRVLAAQLPYAVGEDSAPGMATAAGTAEAGAARAPGPFNIPGPDLGRQHEDARRLARLLVSEIKLYNEDRVVLGRKARDLYERLRDDIARSRQVYTERVSAEVRAAADYFQQELVATLAEGDPALLGPTPAGTS
jgi:hypothetical protein